MTTDTQQMPDFGSGPLRPIHWILIVILLAAMSALGGMYYADIKSFIIEPRIKTTPYIMESSGLVEKSDETQQLLMNLKSHNGDGAGINLFVVTNPKGKYRRVSYGGRSDGYSHFEWEYIRNSLKDRLIWFTGDEIGVALKSYDVNKHAIITGYEKWKTTVDGKDVLCIRCRPEDIEWVNVTK